MAQIVAQPGDLRVRRTRKVLKSALIELTIEKGFAAVTVQDIADRAMINRATFYRHYLDKYDLLGQYMNLPPRKKKSRSPARNTPIWANRRPG
jgi:AcrR family transcriptional regulator